MKEFILKSFIIDKDNMFEEIEHFFRDISTEDGFIFIEDFEKHCKPTIKTFASYPCTFRINEENGCLLMRIKGAKELLQSVYPEKSATQIEDLIKGSEKLLENDDAYFLFSNDLYVYVYYLLSDYDFIYNNDYFSVSHDEAEPEFTRNSLFMELPINQLLGIFCGDYLETLEKYFQNKIDTKLSNISKDEFFKIIRRKL